MLVRIMIQEGGTYVTVKRILWVKTHPDYKLLFSILDKMRQDADRRFWIERLEASDDNCDIEEDTGQMSSGVKIVLQISHYVLTSIEEHVQRKGIA